MLSEHTSRDEMISKATDDYFRLVDLGDAPDIETFVLTPVDDSRGHSTLRRKSFPKMDGMV